jgi:hypothetical protein
MSRGLNRLACVFVGSLLVLSPTPHGQLFVCNSIGNLFLLARPRLRRLAGEAALQSMRLPPSRGGPESGGRGPACAAASPQIDWPAATPVHVAAASHALQPHRPESLCFPLVNSYKKLWATVKALLRLQRASLHVRRGVAGARIRSRTENLVTNSQLHSCGAGGCMKPHQHASAASKPPHCRRSKTSRRPQGRQHLTSLTPPPISPDH